jgi:hypothetical protein
MLFSLVASVFGIVTFFVTRNSKMNPKVLGINVDFSQLSYSKIMIVIGVITALYFVYIKAIYLLKNSLDDLSSGNYFSLLVINNFNKIGKLFLISCVVEFVGRIVLRVLLEKKIGIELDSSVFLFLIMGLFFLFLSEVFAKARGFKQENDLTI